MKCTSPKVVHILSFAKSNGPVRLTFNIMALRMFIDNPLPNRTGIPSSTIIFYIPMSSDE